MSADFAEASRKKLRFNSHVGLITVEDLWDLDLSTKVRNASSLDTVAMGIARELRASEDIASFVDTTKKPNTLLTLKLDIVKHIIEVKKTERDADIQRAVRKAKIEKLRETLSDKEHEEMKGKSKEDLLAQLDELNKEE